MILLFRRCNLGDIKLKHPIWNINSIKKIYNLHLRNPNSTNLSQIILGKKKYLQNHEICQKEYSGGHLHTMYFPTVTKHGWNYKQWRIREGGGKWWVKERVSREPKIDVSRAKWQLSLYVLLAWPLWE